MALASESWLCTTESSQVQGDKVLACGVGTGRDEESARNKALQSAKHEFSQLCQLSTNCSGKAVGIDPKRTTCDEKDGIYKCYRLIVFTVSEKPSVAVTQDKPKLINKDYTINDYFRDMNNKYLRAAAGQ